MKNPLFQNFELGDGFGHLYIFNITIKILIWLTMDVQKAFWIVALYIKFYVETFGAIIIHVFE